MSNNLKNIIQNSAIYGIGNISTRLVGFVLIPIYTKHLEVSEYGILGLLEITSQILITSFSFSLENGLMRWYWDKNFIQRQKSIFFTIMLMLLILATFMNIIFQPFAKQFTIFLFDNSRHTTLIRLMLISSSLQMIIQVPITLMRLQEKPVRFSIAIICRLVITLILTILFIVVYDRNIQGIYEAQIIGQMAILGIISNYVRINIYPKLEKSIIRSMISYSFPLALASISGVLLTVADRYIIKFMMSIYDVGIYSLGFKTANTIKVFLISSIYLALSPINFKMMSHPDHKQFYAKVMLYFGYTVMMAALCLALYSREIIELISLNPNYWQAYKIVPIISFSLVFLALKDTSAIGLHIQKNTKPFAIILLLILIINLGLNFILIPYLKIQGAAVANLISQLIFFILIYRHAQNSYPIPYNLKKVFKMITVGVGLYIISEQFNIADIYQRISIKFILLMLYPLLLYVWNFYEREDILTLRELIQDMKDKVIK